MSLTAYIRYDQTGRIVPGGPIVVKDKPANGNWQPVTEGTAVTLSGKLRAFVKVDRFGKPIASSLFLGKERPATGKWLEVNATYELPVAPTTTTTTSSSTSTTTSTTTTPSFAWTVSSSSVSNRTFACDYGFDYGRQTLWASTNNPNTVNRFYVDQALTQIYYGNMNDYYVYMMGWPSGQLYAAQMTSPGILINQQSCLTTTTTTTTIASTSTTTSTTTTAGPTTTTTTTIPVYTVGQQALGGTIAYILQPGDPGYDSNVQHGLVATISDITTIFEGLFWGCSGINVSGLSSALGAGASNTAIIAATCSDSSFAAKACADLVYGGYSDWYLPSFDELTKLQQNKNLIGNFDADGRLYWSSNQSIANPAPNGLMIQFSSGDTYPAGKLSVAGQVRPVRSF
jgi:hypothetical protein